MTDELDLVQLLLATPVDEQPTAYETTRRRVDAAIAQELNGRRSSRRTWRIRRHPFALLATVATAAAIAVAVIVVAPSEGGPLTQATPAAAAVLDSAAQAASTAPSPSSLRPGQFQYFRSSSNTVVTEIFDPKIGAMIFAPYRIAMIRQDWVAADGSGRIQVTWGQPVFVSSAAQAAWQRTGLPAPIHQPFDQTYSAGGPTVMPYPVATGLPTDPTALRHAIEQRYEGGKRNDLETFTAASTFLQQSATPELRTALYLMLKQLAGVQALGTTTTSGHARTTVGMTQHGVRIELIFDSTTARILEQREVLVDPSERSAFGPGQEKLPVGTLLDDTVFDAQQTVDSTASPRLTQP